MQSLEPTTARGALDAPTPYSPADHRSPPPPCDAGPPARADRREHRPTSIALAIAVAVGCAAVLTQYLANPSLGVDEISVALALAPYPLGELLSGALDYAQVAPPGWIVVQKLLGAIGGYSEWALRLFPTAMAIAAIVLLARLGRRVVPGFAPAVAVAWLGTSLLFLQFGTAVKQYSTDVVVVIVLTLLALDLLDGRQGSARRPVVAGAVGAVLLFFSQAGAMGAAGVGAAIALIALLRRDRALARRAAPTLALWAVAAVIVTALSLRNTTPGLMAYMRRFWSAAFVPFPPRSLEDVAATWGLFKSSFLTELTYDYLDFVPKIFLALLIIGIVWLARHRWDVLAILIAPIAIAFVASALDRYPFGSRVGLFLQPPLFLLIAGGAQVVAGALPRRAWPLAAVGFLLLFVPRARMLASQAPPYWATDTRPMLLELARASRPGDAIYLHHTARKAYRYYGSRIDLEGRRIVEGSCAAGNPMQYLLELDTLRGEPRAWVVADAPQLGEEPVMRHYLGMLGTIQDSVVVRGRLPGGIAGSSFAWRFDLSDPERLAAVRADTLQLPPFMVRPDWGWLCYGFAPKGQEHPSLQE